MNDTITAGRVVLAANVACFSSAADSSVNWMLSGTVRPDTLFDLPAGNSPSQWRESTSRGVGGGAGGVHPLWTKWHRAP